MGANGSSEVAAFVSDVNALNASAPNPRDASCNSCRLEIISELGSEQEYELFAVKQQVTEVTPNIGIFYSDLDRDAEVFTQVRDQSLAFPEFVFASVAAEGKQVCVVNPIVN